jgi:hypothetical protein
MPICTIPCSPSSAGPSSRMVGRFDMAWAQSAWENTHDTSLTASAHPLQYQGGISARRW